MTEVDDRAKAPVSVIIPCYRCLPTIARALESVAAQTFVPAEVILVEDGSQDGTLDHLESVVAAYSSGWIRIVALPENQGAASARNAGWAVAVQPYLALLDADDAWHPRKIELQYGFMAAHPEVALCGHEYEVLATPEVRNQKIGAVLAQPVSRLSMLVSNRFVTPSVMIKREVPFRFLSGRRHVDDHLLWMQVQSAGMQLTKLSARLVYIYKPMFGASGLSAEMWKMERAELENYWILHRARGIGILATLALSLYSFAKFLRRILLISPHRILRIRRSV